jgi:hypothetical protein
MQQVAVALRQEQFRQVMLLSIWFMLLWVEMLPFRCRAVVVRLQVGVVNYLLLVRFVGGNTKIRAKTASFGLFGMS